MQTACVDNTQTTGKKHEALLVPPGAEQMVNLTTKQGIKKADEEQLLLQAFLREDP